VRAGDERAEEGEADEAGGADGEALADGGGGVTRGVEGVGLLADSLGELGHLGDATRVVADGAVDVDGEAGGEVGEHAERGEGDAVHVTEVEGEVDHDGEEGDGEDGGLVAEREAVDDVGGGASLARRSNLADGLVGVGGVVLGDEADHAAGPETRDGAAPGLGGGEGQHGAGNSLERELGGEEEVGEDVDNPGEHDGGGAELNLEDLLDVRLLLHGLDVSGEEGADHAHEDTTAGDGDGEHEAGPATVVDELGGLRGDDERGAGGLGEGAEEIGAHTGDVTDVVTDVVRDGGGVPWVVLGDTRDHLTGEVGADVGSLGVDAAADAAEERDGGATETVAGEGLHEVEGVLVGAPVGAVGIVNKDGVPVLEVDGEEVREDVEHEHGEAAEGESHDGSGAEGGVEGVGPGVGAGGHDGGARVGENGDLHADETGDDGGEAARHEGNRGETALIDLELLLDVRGHQEHDDAEGGDEVRADGVLGAEERVGSFPDGIVDADQLGGVQAGV